MIHKPVVTKPCINGRASEDRDEWTKEVRAHDEKCCDKTETSAVHAERIRQQRSRGDSLVAFQGRQIHVAVDRVLLARGKMMKNKATGLLTEMLLCLPTETVRGSALVRQAIHVQTTRVDETSGGKNRERRGRVDEKTKRLCPACAWCPRRTRN